MKTLSKSCDYCLSLTLTILCGLRDTCVVIQHGNAFIICTCTLYVFQAAARGVRSPITAERITEWLVDNKVLSIALGGES